MVEKLYNEDHTKFAVLVSKGFGTGWSTYNEKSMAYDKRIVEFFIEKQYDEKFMYSIQHEDYDSKFYNDLNNLFKKWGYFTHINFLGFPRIEINWVPVNTPFFLAEYDGNEYFVFHDDIDWITG